MSKISELDPVAAPDGTETVVVLKGGVAKRSAIGTLVSAAVAPEVAKAESWANGTLPGGPGTKSAREWAEEIADVEIPAPVTLYFLRTLTSDDLRRHIYIEIDTPNLMVTPIPIPSYSEQALPIGAAFVGTNIGTGLLQFVSDTTGDATVVPAKAGYLYVPPGGSFRVEQRKTDQWLLSGDLSNEANAFTMKVLLESASDALAKQERTGASATTPSEDGDVVGTWINKGTGARYAVARADVRRPLLDVQADGKVAIVTDGDTTAANADFLELQGLEVDLAKLNLFVAFKAAGYKYASGLVSISPIGRSGDLFNDSFSITMNALAGYPTDYAFQGGQPPNRVAVGVQGVKPNRPHVFEWRKTANDVPATINIDGFEITHTGTSGLPALANLTAFESATVRLLIGANPGNEPQNGAIQHSPNGYFGIALTDTELNKTQRQSMCTYLERKAHEAAPEYPVWADVTEMEAARTALIDEVFGGALPTDIATKTLDTTPPVTGLTGLAAVYKLTIPGEADTNIKPRLWVPTVIRSPAAVAQVWAGHDAGWNPGGIRDHVIQRYLTAGVPVVSHVLPDGPNDFTSGGPANHSGNHTPYAEWARQDVVARNTLLADYPGAESHLTGISGGGWATMFCAALDVRVKKSVHLVGSWYYKHYLNSDWETWLTEISLDELALYVLGASPGREQYDVKREDDAAGVNRAMYASRAPYAEGVAARAAELGGGHYEMIWEPGSLHSYTATNGDFLVSLLP